MNARCVPVNRGQCAVIEATVHATRYRSTRDPRLGRLIEHHAVIVRKCGGPDELEALELLRGYIDPGSIEEYSQIRFLFRKILLIFVFSNRAHLEKNATLIKGR